MLPNKVDNINIRFKRENYINYLEYQCGGHRYIIHIGSALHVIILLYTILVQCKCGQNTINYCYH